MADRPILFSGPMVRAILREIAAPGTGKTQTRRVLKEQSRLRMGINDLGQPAAEYLNVFGSWQPWVKNAKSLRPYSIGDRLWVRETWKWDGVDSIGAATRDFEDLMGPSFGPMFYKADDPLCGPSKWWPGIHMPRWASRLTLTVTDVRVERLQDISEADALAEGAPRLVMDDDGKFYESLTGTHRTGFAGLWEHINGARAGCSWDENPWVVALTFRPALDNIDAAPGAAARGSEMGLSCPMQWANPIGPKEPA